MRLPTEQDFSSRLRGTPVTARVGRWLGVCFAVAFLTGLVSHAAQAGWWFPTRPVWGYRVNQGLHVAAGTAAVPLLLVKLWSVYPRLFTRPPRAWRALGLHAAERASIAVLVAAAIFQVATGLANAAQWYPWSVPFGGFSFRATHYAVAWVAIGALLVHVAVKLPLIAAGLRSPSAAPEGPDAVAGAGPTRRGLLRATWLAATVGVLATAGGTVPWLRRVSVLATRSGAGPGGVPVNKSARAAGVTAAASAASYRLVVAHGDRSVRLRRADLAALPQHTERLPIACVEGWSASGDWTGVRVRDLLDLVGAPRGADVRVTSLQPAGPFRVTTLPGRFADDPLTLLALGLAGEALDLDHGYPCRLIAPNRPGVLQTKWVQRLEVLA